MNMLVLLYALTAAPDGAATRENWPAPAAPPEVASTARREMRYQVRVLDPRTVLFAAPSHQSAALRLCPLGEILTIRAEVDAGGETWLETTVTDGAPAYARKTKLGAPGQYVHEAWAPPHTPRDDRPFGIGAMVWDKTFGWGLHARYNLMSRLGLGFTLGATLDKQGRVHGGVWSLGLNSFLVLWNLSPFVELGVSSLYYDARHASLRVWSFYGTLGLEYLFDFGMFLNVHGTYLIGFSRSVSYDIAAYESGPLGTDSFGPFDVPAGDVFQFLRPGATVGWTF